MNLILDAGALMAADRDDRELHARLAAVRRRQGGVLTPTAAVAQVWRDGAPISSSPPTSTTSVTW